MTSATLFSTPAQVTSAHLKMGLLGFQGSGKTKTATKVTIGLIDYMKKRNITYANRPVYFLDSETGSDWVLPDFHAAGIPIIPAKTRAFCDLITAVKAAEKEASVLIVDSISHFWKELCESYCRSKAKQFGRPSYRLQINDWSYLKGPEAWGKFSELFVNSSLHIVLCGRAGYEFDMDEDEEGNKQLQKTGVKMKAEGEFGFEPSLLVYMELQQRMKGKKVAKQWRDAVVLKDRAALIDGKVFENPGFESFLPHIERLNLGGQHLGTDTTRTSDHMISAEKKDRTSVQRSIATDEIDDLLARHGHAGQATDAKKRRIELLLKHFNTSSKTEIEEVMPLFDLRAGYDSLHRELEGKPSRYAPAVQSCYAPATTIAPTSTAEAIDDALPDHSAAPTAPAEQDEATDEAPASKRKPKHAGLRDRLLADIPHLVSVQDCLHWGMEMSERFDTLGKKDKETLRGALMARQAQIMDGVGEAVAA